jgi:D-alanine-D-alanine ligase
VAAADRAAPLCVVVHDAVPPGAPADCQDTLAQVALVERALDELGWRVDRLSVTTDLAGAARGLRQLAPALVFNLVESLEGDARLALAVPALLDALRIPYTGCSHDALAVTVSKRMVKRILELSGLATPAWGFPSAFVEAAPFPGPYIIKSLYEHGSFGLTERAVVEDAREVAPRAAEIAADLGGCWFVERMLEGAEIYVPLLGDSDAPVCLPISRIDFTRPPASRHRIVGYAAKWETDSGAYRDTTPEFVTAAVADPVFAAVEQIARRCWCIFGLEGYARVDLRLDASGRPSVIDLNLNPCIAPDAGFTRAAAVAGIETADMVRRIVEPAAMRAGLEPPHGPRGGDGA